MERFINQAKEYVGRANRIARCTDGYGEQHVIIEMIKEDGSKHFLDWIGAEYATEPDEDEEQPFSNLRWKRI